MGMGGMGRIDQIIDEILVKEGSAYTNHPSDRGGPTKYGVTLGALGQHRRRPVTAADVEKLTEAEAREVYYHRYVTEPGFDKLLELNTNVAAEVIDAGVLSGPHRSGLWLQMALNAFNQQQRRYRDVPEDGVVGLATRHALQEYLAMRGEQGETVMLRALNALQGSYFIDISRLRVTNEDFVYGWIAHRVAL
jgi:lysozyme family protein